jgi:orotate phosphoribosyltransferase
MFSQLASGIGENMENTSTHSFLFMRREIGLIRLSAVPVKSKTMTTPTHAQQLLSLLARTSFRLGQFTLSSGGTSDYYVDCRTTTLHAEGGRLTGHAILELLEENGIEAEAVGGLTMGADPIVSNVATASAWRAQSNPAAPLLHGFLVRKAEKAHGTGRRIEGFCRQGARVVVVDDVCTTGASTINAIEAAREAGMTVAAVVCIVERQEANGRPAVEAAAQGAPFLSLFTANDVRAEHIRQQ